MIFSSFFDRFPDLVSKEFRSITIFDNGSCKYIPPGNYAFLELFCEDKHCDCHNVMINVVSAEPPKLWVTLRYGWESKKFYRDWYGGESELSQNMPGAYIDGFGSSNDISKEFLKLFTDIIHHDVKYAKRLETHYHRFKELIDNQHKKSVMPFQVPKKVGRNEPCPCGSGTKHKKCCFGKVN